MQKPSIVIHLPALRRRTLLLQIDQREAEPAYAENIAAYLQFLQDEATAAGYAMTTDEHDGADAFSFRGDAAGAKAAHDWLHTQPDLWNWIP